MPNEIQHGTIQFLDINEQVLYEDNDFFGEKIYLADFKDGI